MLPETVTDHSVSGVRDCWGSDRLGDSAARWQAGLEDKSNTGFAWSLIIQFWQQKYELILKRKKEKRKKKLQELVLTGNTGKHKVASTSGLRESSR